MKLIKEIGFGLAVLVAAFALISQAAPEAHAVGAQTTVIGVATTTAATAITSSTRIMATTTGSLGGTSFTGSDNSYNRVYAVVCNPNANPVYLNLDGDKAASLPDGAVTTVIAAAAGYNACYEITDRNQYNGSVTASSTNQTSTTITVKQYVQ